MRSVREAACFNSKCKFNRISVHGISHLFYFRRNSMQERQVKRKRMCFSHGGVTLFVNVCEDCSDSYTVEMRKILSVMND